MNAINQIIENASKLNGTIVLPEGMDARVVTAACACVDRKICKPIVLGTKDEVALAEASVGLSMAARGIKVIDYTKPEETGLPSSNVLQFYNEAGDVVTIRPSGTEPKIKFYFGIKGSDADAKNEALRAQFSK